MRSKFGVPLQEFKNEVPLGGVVGEVVAQFFIIVFSKFTTEIVRPCDDAPLTAEGARFDVELPNDTEDLAAMLLLLIYELEASVL